MTKLFFNLHDENTGIHRSLGDGVSTRIFPGKQAMLSVVKIEANSESASHSHPEEQWGVLLEGNGVRVQDHIEYPVSAGDFWQTPGGISHSFRAGEEGALIVDIFSPPRAEYQKEGHGVFCESNASI